MKVKVGNYIYDSDKQPIMLVLSEEEKEHISNMGPAKHYCSYPNDMSSEKAIEFMNNAGLTELGYSVKL